MRTSVIAFIISLLFIQTILVHVKAQSKILSAVISENGEVVYTLNLQSFEIAINDSGTISSLTFLNSTGANNNKTVSINIFNRISRVGEIGFQYDVEGKLIRIGGISIGYDFLSGKIIAINNKKINYDFLTGKTATIGKSKINYDLYGNIDAIFDNDHILKLRYSEKKPKII